MASIAPMQVHHARLWIKENPEPWRHVKALLLQEARAGRRASIAWAVEEVRKKDYSDIHGKPFKVNNSIRPALARIAIQEHPELAPFVETRRSMADGLV